jgi:hypothetical protein
MFISEEEFAKWDYQTVDGILERVHNRAVESTLKLLPEVIIGLIIKTKGVQNMFETFKEKYPQLADKQNDLMEIIQDIESEDGSLDMKEILAKVPERLRERGLEIPEDQPHTIEEVEKTAHGLL